MITLRHHSHAPAKCPLRSTGIQALDLAAGFLRDDPVGVAALWDTVGQLADKPRPPESFPYGSPNLRRLRAGRDRVFYTIDEEGRVIQIDHVARLP
jgi:mRNA interferase RelE/StbE